MGKMPDTAIFAKPDIRDAIITMKGALKKALPNGSFAERERASLALSNEVVRQTLEEELQLTSEELRGQCCR